MAAAAVLMVTAEGKCSIKVLRPEDETRDSETSGQTSSITVSSGSRARLTCCEHRVVQSQTPAFFNRRRRVHAVA